MKKGSAWALPVSYTHLDVYKRQVYNIIPCASCCHNCARAAILPQIKVMLGIKGDDPAPGCSAGRLNAHCILLGNGKQPERVCFPQVILGQKRQLVQICYRTDVSRLNPLLLHEPFVIWHMCINMLNSFDKPFALPRLNPVSYTHLDVYKRQGVSRPARRQKPGSAPIFL